MKLHRTVLGVILLVLLVLNPNGVEARPAPADGHQKKLSSYSLFVFGDDFADNGNLPLTDPVTQMSRQWAYPYGSSYVDADGNPRPNTPSGRFSIYKIQSDFIATVLGLEEAPPAHALTAEKTCDPSGMTFAHGGAGVLETTSAHKVPTLAKQVDTFKKMVKDGIISEKQLSRSVALVAISGNDYHANTGVIGLTTPNDINAYIAKVTKEIADNVDQLQKLGVTKVLVNNLHPVGCTPSQTRTSNYTACDVFGNLGASVHNNNLKQVMEAKKNAHVVDLYTAFSNIVDNAPEFLSVMGDYKIQISTKLIEQLARDDEKVKRKVRKPKPKKVVEQRDEPQDNGRELPSEPKISPTPAPGWQLPPPMYLPVTPAPPSPPSPAIQEVEAIRAVVAESENVLEKLDKQGAGMQQELTRRAKELHDREFKLPYQNPSPCTDEKADCRECYMSNAAQDPLKCAEAVRRFEACVRMARHSSGVQAGQ